jgi:hypothetical protein
MRYCRVCGTQLYAHEAERQNTCISHCPVTPNGAHQPRWEHMSFYYENGAIDIVDGRAILDVPCGQCGQLGSFGIQVVGKQEVDW